MLCYVIFCCITYVSLLGTAITRLRRGGEGDFLGNGGKGGVWLGPPFP